MFRSSFGTFVGTFIGGLFLTVALAAPGFAEDAKPEAKEGAKNDCKVAKDETTEIGKACKEGGIKRAKAVMKAMTKQAKKAGLKLDCDTCHKDEDNWELNKDGKDKFKEMTDKIAAAAK